MQQAITDRFQTARDQIRSWRSARREEFDEKRQTLVARKDEAVGTLITRKDEAVDGAKERLITVEANVLETARDLLGWASEQLGPRAGFVKRGEDALTDALVSLRAGHRATLPLDGFDELSVKKAGAALDAGDFDEIALRTLRAYEVSNKNRKTLLADLDRRLAALDAVAPTDEVVADAPAANDAQPLDN